jgi:Ca2+-binding RTX toxin-like protein
MGAGNDHVFAGDGTNVIALGAGNNSTDGGAGTDTVTAGSGDDFIDVMAGNNTVNAGDGNNTIVVAGSGTNNLTGGTGNDHFELEGDAGEKNTVHAGDGDNQVYGFSAGFDTVFCGSGQDSISVGDGGSKVDAGAGNDFISGGAGHDIITGGLGADNMGGAAGHDVFIYAGAADSTSATHDRIFSFDVHQDVFDLPTAVTGIDPNRSGSLNAATFDHDLRKIFSAAHLAADHAAVVTVTAGDLAGHDYLVIDADGVAGYQQGTDYVMEITTDVSTHFNLGDFI